MTWAPPSPVSTYDVVLRAGLWCVTPLGSTLAPFFSKASAIGAAADAASRHRPARVVVHDDAGGVEDVRTFTDDAGVPAPGWRVAVA